MLLHYFPTGILGLGLTALLASFMSGMAGNVTAFNTVWTYDLYQSYIHKGASDAHYLTVGRWATVGGILLSIGTAYAATSIQQHHGHAAAGLLLRECAAVCDLPAGHVLEAHDRPRRIYRPDDAARSRPSCITGSRCPSMRIPASTADGSPWCITIPATWRRTSGRRSGPFRQTSSSR